MDNMWRSLEEVVEDRNRYGSLRGGAGCYKVYVPYVIQTL